jgi:TRAP-type C4-dicarboxylate transport system permease small subunit
VTHALRAARLLAVCVLALSACVLAAYLGGQEAMSRWFHSGPPMAISTATAFAALSLAVFLVAETSLRVMVSPSSSSRGASD